ncbi:uncharacterized protein LOC144138193 [Haemaphysalis longicornis]
MKSYAFAFAAVLALAGVASASSGSGCVNITVSGALDLGNCLGSNLNYCSGTGGTTGAVQGLTKLLSCLFTGLYTYGSPQGVVNALTGLLTVIVGRLSIPGINLSALNLCPSGTTCPNFFQRNDTCSGQINIALPGVGNLSSCVGDAAMLCTAGSPTTTSQVQALVSTVTCILRQIPLDQLMSVLRNVGCQLISMLNMLAQSASVSVAAQTALTAITVGLRTVLMLPTCPTSSG